MTINNDYLVINLIKPRLIDFVQKHPEHKKGESFQMPEFGLNSMNVKSYRDERKNKNYSKIDSEIETKNNKMKFKKRGREKGDRKNSNLFIHSPDHELLSLNNDDFEKSLIKSHKLSRKKKKTKIESDTKDFSLDMQPNVVNDSNNSLNANSIVINNPLTIHELSRKLKIPETEIITNLFLKGFSVTINQVIDVSVATELAQNYNFNVLQNDSNDLNLHNLPVDNLESDHIRPPIVTIFGHVDHGKTTLLSAIVKSTITEVGGITQAINSYEIEWFYESAIRKLVFLDTPGHEAFFHMRSLGIQVTDIAILVVAADDGLKPQTIEAIKYIVDYKVPCIIAITKIDQNDIDLLKLRQDLAQHNIVDESWGGNYPVIEVNALTGKNIDTLLSNICILSDMYNRNLKVNLDQKGKGLVLESHLDRKRGAITNIIIKDGIVKQGDIIIIGSLYNRIKSITSINGPKIERAFPSSIVEILGLSSVSQVGSIFLIVDNEKEAKRIIEDSSTYVDDFDIKRMLNTRITLDSYKNSIKQFNVILKADTQGSIEAIIYTFSKMSQDKVQINVLSATSGVVSNSDLQLALSANAAILCFNTNVSYNIQHLIGCSGVVIKTFSVIYSLIDYVEDTMISLANPKKNKILMGEAIVRTVFPLNKGTVAGCVIVKGKLQKSDFLEVYSNNKLVYEGTLDSLKHLKDDVEYVNEGTECGIMCKNYNSWLEKDIIKVYHISKR